MDFDAIKDEKVSLTPIKLDLTVYSSIKNYMDKFLVNRL